MALQLMKTYTWSKSSSIWFCGLSGAGKTTVSKALKELIETKTNAGVVLLDGDELVELFSSKQVDRSEEARIERVNKYLTLVGILLKTPRVIPIVTMINHRQELREMLRNSPLTGHYVEAFINTSLEICKQRDPKGHYAKAESNDCPRMIGLDISFEAPVNADISLTESNTPAESADLIFQELISQKVFRQ